MIRLLLPLLVLPVAASAASLETCLLDRLPSAQNDIAAAAEIRGCNARYANNRAPLGAGRGFFSYSTPDECIRKKASSTSSALAAQGIAQACYRLYTKP